MFPALCSAGVRLYIYVCLCVCACRVRKCAAVRFTTRAKTNHMRKQPAKLLVSRSRSLCFRENRKLSLSLSLVLRRFARAQRHRDLQERVRTKVSPSRSVWQRVREGVSNLRELGRRIILIRKNKPSVVVHVKFRLVRNFLLRAKFRRRAYM